MGFLDNIGQWVELVSYKAFKPGPETDFADSIFGSWYVSPAGHGLEFLTVVPTCLSLATYYGNKAIFKNRTNCNMLKGIPNRQRRDWLENAFIATMIASYAVTVIHKIATSTEYFLLQPCHANAVLLVVIMAWPQDKGQFIPQLLFNFYLHTLWGSILALVFPDLRDHDLLGEVFNFFLEHGLILILPFYLVWTKRYVVLPLNKDFALFSFFAYIAYHSPLLHAVSLWSGYNINYTLVTPAIPFLIAIGHWYRFVMCSSAFILTFLTRYVLVEGFIKLFVPELACSHNNKKKVQ